MKRMGEEKCLVYITDDKYVDLTLVSMKSVLLTAREPLVICVVCNAVSRLNKERLRIDPCIRLIDYAGKRIAKYSNYRHVSPSSFIKFDLPEIIPFRRCLYIDGDTIASKDISGVFDYEVGEYYAAVMKDFGREYCYKSLAREDKFYSGTMLLNLERMRKDRIAQKCHAVKQEHLEESEWNDMEVFNIVLAGKVVYMPVRCCVSIEKIRYGRQEWRDIGKYNALYGTDYKSIEELVRDAAIYHFHGDKSNVYEHKEIYELIDSIEEQFAARSNAATFIFSNVCRFEDKEDFRKQIATLEIKPCDTLIFLNTSVWLQKFFEEMPRARIVTLQRFRRNGSGWWGLPEVMELKENKIPNLEIMLLDNAGDICTLQGELRARVELADYPDKKIATTGFFAYNWAKQSGMPNIRLVNFYGSKDLSTPHWKPHGWEFEEQALHDVEHIGLEPKGMSIGDIPAAKKGMAVRRAISTRVVGTDVAKRAGRETKPKELKIDIGKMPKPKARTGWNW